jgi:hypothetical protein
MAFFKKHLVALFILVLGIGILSGAFGFLRWRTNTIARDLERLSDMHVLRSSFTRMYQDDASYENAKCKEGDQVHYCMLESYDPNIVVRQDPSGFPYLVKKTPDGTAYQISFTLEHSYKNLPAGEHLLSEAGIE